jgi:hypothetical protein
MTWYHPALAKRTIDEGDRQMAELKKAVLDYLSECDNPVPDANYRRVLRNRLRTLTGAPAEPPPRRIWAERERAVTHPMSMPWLDWKPMKTAPKDGSTFLATMAGGGNDAPYYVLFWNEAYFEDASSGVGPSLDHLTHWAEIPAPST